MALKHSISNNSAVLITSFASAHKNQLWDFFNTHRRYQALSLPRRANMIEIVDRAELEQAACQCYGIISAEYQRVIGSEPYRRDGNSNAANHR
jgi:hypothetical protein